MSIIEQNKDSITFKKLLGKVHTQESFIIQNESIPTNISMGYNTVFGEDILRNPYSGGGLIEAGSSDNIVEKLRFEVEVVPDTKIGTNQSQAYRLKIPSGYNGVLSTTYSGGEILYESLGKLQLVSPQFGSEYEIELLDGNSVTIDKFNSINWVLDYYSGIIFVQNPPAGFDLQSTRPSFVDGYLYVGKYLDEIEFGSSITNIYSGSTTIISGGTTVISGGTTIIQEGDTVISGGTTVISGGTGVGERVQKEIFQNTHGFIYGDIISFNGTQYEKADASTSFVDEAIGIVTEIVNTNEFVVTYLGFIDGVNTITPQEGGSLLPATKYYLSADIGGKITANPPTTIGNIVKPILVTLTSNSANIINQRAELVVAGGINGTTQQRIEKEITQSSHGFISGDVVAYSGGTYQKAIASVVYDYDVFGIVTNIVNVNTFIITYSGHIESIGSWGLGSDNTYYLSDTVAGSLTAVEPITIGSVSKPMIVTTSSSEGLIVQYRGVEIVGSKEEILVTTTATFNVSNNDSVLIASGTTQYNLPITPIVGLELTFIDGLGTAGTGNAITLDGNGKLIVGFATAFINTDYGVVTIIYNGIFWNVKSFIS